MIAYCWYMLKVSISIIMFYSFYFLVLRNSTYFLLNRFYLILGLLLSFVLPILKLSLFTGQSNAVISSIIQAALIEPEYVFFQPQHFSHGINSIHISSILSVIYVIGISIMFFRLLFSIITIIRIKKNAEIIPFGNMKIVKTESNEPFSFFNHIFLPKDSCDQMIIEHEMAHIRQFHWADLILAEIASALLWFNPFVVLYKNSLKLQHEYLADSTVIRDNQHAENYLDCMLSRIHIVNASGLISHFYCKTIKKRIIMITKNKTSVKYLGVYLFTLPLACLLLFAFTRSIASVGFASTKNSVETDSEFIPSIYPVDAKKITKVNGYGERINPITKKKDFHYGIDFKISEGEKVISTAKGVVVDTKFDTKLGNFISVKHNNEYSTFYAHLKSVSVKVGDKLEKGQEIGLVGNTGTYSTGPHLHYGVFKSGKEVNPKDYLPQ